MNNLNPDKLFDDIASFISESRELLKTGAMMELAGLDSRVLVLCEEVLLLSKEARAQYEGRLQQLFSELDALSKELTARRDAIGFELQSLPKLKKATVAYKVVDASDRRGDD